MEVRETVEAESADAAADLCLDRGCGVTGVRRRTDDYLRTIARMTTLAAVVITIHVVASLVLLIVKSFPA